MPENTVYVGRPSKWGNPYHVTLVTKVEEVLPMYKLYLERRLDLDPHFLDDLKGKDLACWCPLDKPCHADIILAKLTEVE